MPPFSLTQGSDRTHLGPDELAALKTGGTVIIDERRRRTRYFDGRFLAAKDQIRDQEYVLTRLSDLGRAGGMGVVSGLMLTGAGPSAIKIGPGNGITPAGEMVLVPNDLTIDLSDIAAIEQIDAAFGLSRIPRDPARNRTGLFVVGLRPVEYTANPIASYPTTISGQRTLQDGDIIEASAVVFIPYPVEGSRTETDRRRSQVARHIFVGQGALGVPGNVLPLAMVAIDRGVILWVDAFMVRREVGAEHGSILTLGYTSRALREAHILQYQDQLREIMQLLEAGNRGQRFPASDYFDVLPPAGVVPTAAIDPTDFSQIFFPAQIETELSVLPADEAAVLVEESIQLPAIDLTDSAQNLQSTSVLFVVPVPRSQLKDLRSTLSKIPFSLKAAAPGMISQHLPLESLRGLVAQRTTLPVVDTDAAADSAWRKALALNPLMWYVRRRNLNPAAQPPTLSETQPAAQPTLTTAQPTAQPPALPVAETSTAPPPALPAAQTSTPPPAESAVQSPTQAPVQTPVEAPAQLPVDPQTSPPPRAPRPPRRKPVESTQPSSEPARPEQDKPSPPGSEPARREKDKPSPPGSEPSRRETGQTSGAPGPPRHEPGETSGAPGPARRETGETSHPSEPARRETGETAHPSEPARREPGEAVHPSGPARRDPGESAHPLEPVRREPGESAHPSEPLRREPGGPVHSSEPLRREPGETAHPSEPPKREPGGAARAPSERKRPEPPKSPK